MLVLNQIRTDPEPCMYLPDRNSEMEYLYVARLSGPEYEALMNRGYRKFGAFLFRPVCIGCEECQSLRVDAAEFNPNRSQRRAWKRNQDLEVRLGPPVVDRDRLDLYERYHAWQAVRKGWPPKQRSENEYRTSFVENPAPAVEISLWLDASLVGIVLLDVTPAVVSAVYHYYDPALVDRSLGTFSLLCAFDLAKNTRRRWVYFGYYVAGCSSMSYKALFRPCEVLKPNGRWVPLNHEPPVLANTSNAPVCFSPGWVDTL